MTVRTLAAGIGFTEGPVWTTDQRLLVVALSRGAVVEIGLDGGVRGRVDVGGGPNGLAEDRDGTVWIAQNGGTVRPSSSGRPARPGLQCLTADGVAELPVPGVRAPNDLVEGPDGRIWFTDPGPPGATDHGCVHALDRASGAVETVLADVDYPNGLAFSDDELYVARTSRGTVGRYRWDGDRLLPGGPDLVLPRGGPDGLALDAEGRVYAAAPEANSIVVFGRDGTVEEEIRFAEPTFPTNLCFAGPGLELLVVTAAKGGRVLVCERTPGVPGRPLVGRPS
ncbi:SMP-30/gluconolactonase/LRE family protein [Pseudonocardia sp. HH130630-07]|uniref:SMP-30/gluconolactonase/LRE family protein n=1 Tax=Pseudonocardia sp. HH130630-07 TaxID=1690815 RepID=UPI000814ECDA|nr:SMP-30/gluconolactonase/LRE family protein [Pseudonocardia sp. HH130630-07]ANY06364.1 hypothetical protein AFB00_08735 [Pseudonocardia sp. HH130630-07]